MAGIAGSVSPVFRDEGYVADATYDFYHAIIHNNKLYFCRQDGTIGHEPQETSDEYWFLSLDGNFADSAMLGGETAEQWQEKITNIINGTTPAGNALKLNNKEAKEYMKFVGTVDASFINGYERANPYIAHVSSPTAVELGLPSDYHKILNIPDNADGYATQIAFPANDFTIVPHYRHCGSGIWHDWKVFGDGCNAMTLNGLTAEEFAKFNPNLIKTADGLVALFEESENGIFFGEVSEVTIESVGLTYARGIYIIQKDNKYGNITFIGNGVLVIRQLINGNWQNWKSSADGGNADTVGGYHASELLKTLGINGAVGGGNAEGDTPNWQDAPDKKQTWYYYEGIDTEAYNLPTPYCTVVVNKLNYARASALAISWTTGEIWSNALWSTWQGWKKGAFADEVLPLTGGTVGDGIKDNPIWFRGNAEHVWTTYGLDDGRIVGFIGINSEGKLQFDDTKVGRKDILHTGNSLKVQASNDAPTDANTMWYDTANKTWKRYVDGAWQA